MINRYLATCVSCETCFTFRAVVPLATTDGIRFCCPHCKVELCAGLTLDYSVPSMNLDAHGFTLTEPSTDFEGPVVTVATDLPVHRSKHSNALSDGGSPFLHLVGAMGESVMDWKRKVDALQLMRQKHLPAIRELTDYARQARWPSVRSCLERIYGEEFEAPGDIPVIDLCSRTMATLYAPLSSSDEMAAVMEDYYRHLNACLESHRPSYKDLLAEWASLPQYRGFRSKTFGSLLRVIQHFDAFIVGVLYNEMPKSLKESISDYRIFRDDYSVVKGLYQDLFELVSQALIFIGAVVNLAQRAEAWRYITGANSFRAITRQPAFERFGVLKELPVVQQLLGAVSRPMRNSIGHFAADYHPCTGDIRFDDGTQMNYIAFLGEFFNAVKAIWFLLVVVEKADMDMTRFSITIPSG